MIQSCNRCLWVATTTVGHQRAKIFNQYSQCLQATKNLVLKRVPEPGVSSMSISLGKAPQEHSFDEDISTPGG